MNKLEELCKLMGIEPKYIIKSEGHTFIYSLANRAEAQRQLQWLGYVNQNIDDYLVNVDLELPSNFVKLLFLKFKLKTSPNIADYIFDREYINSPTEFIDILIQCVEREHFSDEDIEELRHQAQQTEWEY